MCGLFAGVGKLSSNRMIALGSMNEERGVDSVGLAYITDGEIRIAKIAERPIIGLNVTLRKEVTEAAVSGLFIGHTRQATQGTVNSRNAHPFLDDGIAFAHNGIIINDGDFGKYEVDSESLIHGIKTRNFSKYQGPIALVWIEDGKLNAYRCGNPLARGRFNGSTYLASEADYLKDIGCTNVKELSEGMIYTFLSPFNIRTQRVPRNSTFGTSYVGKKDHEIYTGTGWKDYQDLWNKPEGKTPLALLPDNTESEFPPEDFRTSSDISKAIMTNGVIDHCDVCGEKSELSDKGMCVDCMIWLDSQGLDKDSPPLWLKGVH